MEPLQVDLKELLTEFSEFSKAYSDCKKQNKNLHNGITVVTRRLKTAQEAEEKIRCKLIEKQNTIAHLQDILNGYMHMKEENECLKAEVKKIQELFDQEKNNHAKEKENWALEKDLILSSNREEVENMKKIRNMEVSSLNRQISHIHEDNERKLQILKQEIENEYKDELSRTVMDYEEKVAKLGRDLVFTQSELRNLRQSANETASDMKTFSVAESVPNKERPIPQPLSYARYKPVAPVVSRASELLQGFQSMQEESPEKPSNIEHRNTLPQLKKKKKLYSRTDDEFL